MSTMKEIHKKKLKDRVLTIKHKFRMCYKKKQKNIYAFVEGIEDPAYYHGKIADYISRDDWDVDVICCHGKKNVTKIFDAFDWTKYDSSQIVFFVDRDLSNYINDPNPIGENVYITDGYSIENSLLSRQTCARVLKELLNFHELGSIELKAILDLFEEQYELFAEYMIPVMAWIIQSRRNGKEPNLNNIKLNSLVSFDEFTISFSPLLENEYELIRWLHNSCKVADCHISNSCSTISEIYCSDNYRMVLRGKFAIWFLVYFCNNFHENCLAKTCPTKVEKQPKLHVTLGATNAMTQIAPRSVTPTSLANFFYRTIGNYINLPEFSQVLR